MKVAVGEPSKPDRSIITCGRGGGGVVRRGGRAWGANGYETSIVKKDALIKELDGKIAIQDKMIAQQTSYIDELNEAINSRKCHGCGKKKQDVDRMYDVCCLCGVPVRPGQSIEEAWASCKER